MTENNTHRLVRLCLLEYKREGLRRVAGTGGGLKGASAHLLLDLVSGYRGPLINDIQAGRVQELHITVGVRGDGSDDGGDFVDNKVLRRVEPTPSRTAPTAEKTIDPHLYRPLTSPNRISLPNARVFFSKEDPILAMRAS